MFNENPNFYVAESYRCAGCEMLQWEQHTQGEQEGDTKGIHVRLVPAERAKRPNIPSKDLDE